MWEWCQIGTEAAESWGPTVGSPHSSHMLSPFAPQGSGATAAQNTQQEDGNRTIFPVDIQAKPDVPPLFRFSFSSNNFLPTPVLPIYLFLPVSSFPQCPSFPSLSVLPLSLWEHVPESFELLSYKSDSFNRLLMFSTIYPHQSSLTWTNRRSLPLTQ